MLATSDAVAAPNVSATRSRLKTPQGDEVEPWSELATVIEAQDDRQATFHHCSDQVVHGLVHLETTFMSDGSVRY